MFSVTLPCRLTLPSRTTQTTSTPSAPGRPRDWRQSQNPPSPLPLPPTHTLPPPHLTKHHFYFPPHPGPSWGHTPQYHVCLIECRPKDGQHILGMTCSALSPPSFCTLYIIDIFWGRISIFQRTNCSAVWYWAQCSSYAHVQVYFQTSVVHLNFPSS